VSAAARNTITCCNSRQETRYRFTDELGDPYVASAYDEDGRVGIDWGVYGAPETFLVSPDGNVVYKHIGPMDESVWQSEFVPRIAAQGMTK
jgi:cytochrome c biogenesis protein CcmG/thiol:disulfide interchange protein DsbE